MALRDWDVPAWMSSAHDLVSLTSSGAIRCSIPQLPRLEFLQDVQGFLLDASKHFG